MRIWIREKGGVSFKLLLPTAAVVGLLGSRPAARLIVKAVQAKVPADGKEDAENSGKDPAALVRDVLQPETVRKIQKELKDCIRKNRGLTLAEVESADGDYVKIVL